MQRAPLVAISKRMIKERPLSVVTVIGSGVVSLDDGSLALSLYTYEKGSIGFRINPKTIEIIREELAEAEAKFADA